MGTISVKIIKNPRKVRFCEGYRHHVLMDKPHIRLFGGVGYCDKPYAMYICLKCATESHEPIIRRAVDAAKEGEIFIPR